jgi:hypothetical protein
LRPLSSQWSPTFSWVCLREANAVRWARSPSPYWSTAASWVLPQVSRAFFDERATVEGMSFLAGIVITSIGRIPGGQVRKPDKVTAWTGGRQACSLDRSGAAVRGLAGLVGLVAPVGLVIGAGWLVRAAGQGHRR